MSGDDPRESAIKKADELRNELEAIASTDLPFAQDAQKILEDLKNNEQESN